MSQNQNQPPPASPAYPVYPGYPASPTAPQVPAAPSSTPPAAPAMPAYPGYPQAPAAPPAYVPQGYPQPPAYAAPPVPQAPAAPAYAPQPSGEGLSLGGVTFDEGKAAFPVGFKGLVEIVQTETGMRHVPRTSTKEHCFWVQAKVLHIEQQGESPVVPGEVRGMTFKTQNDRDKKRILQLLAVASGVDPSNSDPRAQAWLAQALPGLQAAVAVKGSTALAGRHVRLDVQGYVTKHMKPDGTPVVVKGYIASLPVAGT